MTEADWSAWWENAEAEDVLKWEKECGPVT
jgi:hypothetical protein